MAPRTRHGDRRWSCEELSRNIHRITINLPRVGDEQYVLLQSDVHNDNPKCDRVKWAAHMDQARERDAPVIDAGDWFCAMQGKWDKRANKDDLRPEHQVADYLDALVRTSADLLLPYADLLTVRAPGNHETSVAKRHETNLTERLVQTVKTQAKSSAIAVGGFSGFIVFRIVYNLRNRKPFKLFYHHGYGGGGPVTLGVIGHNRRAAYLADADMVWTGHVHESWMLQRARVRLNQDNTAVEHTTQTHICTPGYKNEYGDGYGGWHIETGKAPKPIGAYWLRFRYPKTDYVEYDAIEAK